MNKQVKYLFAIIIVAFAICLEIYHFPMQSQNSITRDKDTYDITSIDDNAIALAGTMPTDQTAQLAAFNLCNKERTDAGLPALTWSNDLATAAMVRSKEIVSTWSHTRPNGQDWYTVNASIMYGENLAKGYSSAQECVDAWMASPGHRTNIMAADFKTCGIAIYKQGNMWYWAQEFGY